MTAIELFDALLEIGKHELFSISTLSVWIQAKILRFPKQLKLGSMDGCNLSRAASSGQYRLNREEAGRKSLIFVNFY